MIWSLEEIRFVIEHFRGKNEGDSEGKWPEGLHVLAQYDPSGCGIPTVRYDFQKVEAGQGIYGLEDYAEIITPPEHDTNCGSPDSIIRFIEWGARRHPADNYFVVLSGHGSGADEDFFLWDENPADSLSLPELRPLSKSLTGPLGDPRTIVLGMDSCLMSMCEVAYQVWGNVDVLIASEGFSPNSGWPYGKIIAAIANLMKFSPPLTAAELGKIVAREYIHFYACYPKAGRSVDVAALATKDSNSRNCLTEAVNELATRMIREIFRDRKTADQIALARWKAQGYKDDQYCDLYDFCDQLGQLQPRFSKPCEAVKAIIQGHDIVFECRYNGPRFQHSHGLSVYFPWSRISPSYRRIRFAEETCWLQFLAVYLTHSRRDPRKGDSTVSLPPSFEIYQGVLETEAALAMEHYKDQAETSREESIKYVDTIDKYVDTIDKVKSGRPASMKNPPLEWFPCRMKSAGLGSAPKSAPTKTEALRKRMKRAYLDSSRKANAGKNG